MIKSPKAAHVSWGRSHRNYVDLGAIIGGHLVWLLQLNAVAHLVMKGAWQVWRVRNCASGAYLILPTQSSHKYLWGVVFSMGFHISCSWQDWWGWLPLCIIALVEGWKAAIIKAVRAACSCWPLRGDSSSLVLWSCLPFSSLPLHFAALNNLRKRLYLQLMCSKSLQANGSY